MNGGIWDGEAKEEGNITYLAQYTNSPQVERGVTVQVKVGYTGVHVAQAIAAKWNENGPPFAWAHYLDSRNDYPRGGMWIAASVQLPRCEGKLPDEITFTPTQ